MPPFVIPFLAKAAPYIAVAALFIGAGVWIAHKAPFIGLDGRIASLTSDRDKARAERDANWHWGAAEKAAFDRSEALRAEEAKQANASATSADKACAARVATARQSTAAIAAITTKAPQYDQNACPVRVLVAPDSVRHALGYPASR
jgi:hypothetical protein